MNAPTRRQIAVHEAGHAVMHRHFGLTVAEVSVVKEVEGEAEEAGYCLTRSFTLADAKRLTWFEVIETQCCVNLAGFTASRLFLGDGLVGHSSSDFARVEGEVTAAAHSFGLSEDERNALMAAFVETTAEVLVEERAEVLRLADALMETDTLTEQEIEGLLRGKVGAA